MQTKALRDIEKKFGAKFEYPTLFSPGIYNGFTFPKTPVITNRDTHTIKLYNWGLVPAWCKDLLLRKNTLNAMLETIHEKASFKNSVANRCIVLVDGFFEWQWLDEKGKKKQKYQVGFPDGSPFAFAGLYNQWLDRNTGEVLDTYTILTSAANELMSEIHNNKKRMPVVLTPGRENEWLENGLIIPGDAELVAEKVF